MRISFGSLALVAATVLMVSNVSAEPPAPAAKAEKKATADSTKNSANKVAPLKLTISESTAARSLDFSPLPMTPTAEKQRGFSLGDDSSWKTHALQAGAMTALFGALVGLCSGGACMVPNAVTDPLPSWLKAKPHQVIDPRPRQPVRKL